MASRKVGDYHSMPWLVEDLEDIHAPEDPEDEVNTRVNLDKDTSSGAMLAILKLYDGDTVERDGYVPLLVGTILSMMLQIMNVVIQFTLVFLLYAYTVERAEDPYEHGLVKEADVLRRLLAAIPPMRLDQSDPVQKKIFELCEYDHNVPYTQSLLIFLWVVKMLPEMMDSAWLVRIMWLMPTAKRREFNKMLSYPDRHNKDKIHILQLTRKLRWGFLMLGMIPRFVIAIFLCFVGAKFLMYAKSLGMLVIKSLALAFVTQVDDILFCGLASHSLQTQTKSTAFCLKVKPGNLRVQWNLWGATLARTSGVIVLVLIWTRVVHRHLQTFRELCDLYDSEFETCPTCGLHLFGLRFRN